jgi:hypothetical protein
MSQAAPPKFFPAIDEEKVPEEVAKHIRLLYDRVNNHFTAIGNLQTQVNTLQAQLKAQSK